MLLVEYAIEPEALSSWESFRYISDQCGISKGRLISEFPNDWCKAVLHATIDFKPIARSKVIIALKRLKTNALINMYRDFDTEKDWQSNAIESNKKFPFHAIIAQNPKSSMLLNIESLDESDPKWNVPRELPVLRKADDLALASSYLLMMAKETIFIDPYFSPDDFRCRNSLEKFLNNISFPIRRFEFHIAKRTSGSAEHFEDMLKRKIIPMLTCNCEIPSEQEFYFIRWSELPSGDGEKLHARYLLTDKGGLRYEHGLAEGEDSQTTDVSLLDELLFERRRTQYSAENDGCFRFVDGWRIENGKIEPITIENGEWIISSS